MPFQQNVVAWRLTNCERVRRYAFIPQLFAAFLFLGFAYWTGKDHSHLLFKGSHTQGEVVGFKPVVIRSSRSDSFSRTANMPIIQFRAGDHITQFQEWKSSRFDPALHAQVPVLYDPAAPSVAMMDRGAINWIPWAPCAAIGLLLALAGLKGLLSLRS